MKRGEAILACTFLGIFLFLVVIATGYNPKARRMPLVVGIPGVVLSMVEVARQTIGKRRSGGVKAAAVTSGQEGSQTDLARSDERQKILRSIGWMVLIVILIWAFGFIIGLPLFSMIFMKAKKEGWVMSIAVTAAGMGVLYFLFMKALEMDIYRGLLFQQ